MFEVLELGNYIVPAYAGMILAEQGHKVTKWTNFNDPILGLERGQELWDWINYRKVLTDVHPSRLLSLRNYPHIIIDNFRPSTLEKWGIDPARIAADHKLVWVSMRSEVGEYSFDLLAQARAWMEYAPWMPFYIGDTAGGLWLAFKALAVTQPGHYTLGHASCLQKMVEGELVIDVARDGRSIVWDKEEYRFNEGQARIMYKGQLITETPKSRAWKLKHLRHRNGRIVI